MKSKPISKLILTITFCFLLILRVSLVLEVESHFSQSTKTEASISQKSITYDSHNQMNLFTPTEKEREPFSSSQRNWDFNKVNELARFAKVNDDSVELVVGISDSYTKNYDELSSIIRTHKGKIVNKVSMGGKISTIVADIPLTSISSFMTDMNTADISTYLEPNFKFEANFIPNDPYWNQQWGLINIGADYAWNRQVGNRQLGNNSVLVAVIDTGINWNHPDLAANYVALGYDWVNNDTDPMDDNGHGTHCAGIIAAALNNSIGIAGLAQVRIMVEKGLNQYGEGCEDDLANAIIHAVDQGADILSNSWGGYEDSILIHDAVKYAYEKGVLIVAAAGNNAWDDKAFPAGYDEVIAVTATDSSDNPASFTNFGDWVELAAPGVHIYSTFYNDDYAYMSGTSMACPHVSGVAALVWSQFPYMTRDWVRLWLRYTADDLGDSGFDVYYGYGRINAEKAVEEPPIHDLLISDLEAPRYIEPGSVGNLTATVFNLGKSNETNLTVELFANGSIVDAGYVDFLASGVSSTVNFSWNPMSEGKYDITFYVVPVMGEDNISNNGKSAKVMVWHPKVAIFKNFNPWGSSANEEVLNLYDVPYVTLSPQDFGLVNLSRFIKVVIASDQDQVFYDAINASRWWLEDYVRNGGVLEIHAADMGWHDGHWIGSLPGGLRWETHETNYVYIVNRTHPVVNAPNFIADNELDEWWWSTHGHFSSYPNNSCVVIVDGSSRPVYLEFKYGAGLIAASGQTLEWAYERGYTLMLENSLLNLVYKYKHELATFLDTAIFLVPGDSALINATVINYGLSNETNVDLQILIDGNIVGSVVISELATGARYTLSYLWTPTKEGIYNVTAYAPPLSGEKVENNGASEIVRVRPLRYVLFDQTHGTDNIASYSIWVTALSERGFMLDIHTTGAITSDLLDDYDVFIIPQADSPYLPSEISAVQKFVFNGGGLLVIGDDCPSVYTNLTSFAGITWTGGGTSGITTDITPHPVTSGVASIYLNSPVARMNVTDVAQDIVRHEGDIMLTVSVQLFGKVIGFADEHSLWDLSIHGRDNLRLANNMVEWLATPVQHEISVKLESPTYLRLGNSVSLNATVCNRGLCNETNVQLLILIQGSVVDSVIIPELKVGSNYTLCYQWTPIIVGVYNVTAYSPSIPGEENTINNVVSKTVHVNGRVRVSAVVIIVRGSMVVFPKSDKDPRDYENRRNHALIAL
jgi:thermitase